MRVGVVHRADDVHQAQLVGFELEGVGIDHDLPLASAERLRARGAGNARDLIADLVLGEIAQAGFR